MMYDYLIVGAGFTGCVLAERLATQLDKRVLLVEKRPHIGGLASDIYNQDGIQITPYGTHVFYTNSGKVFQYISQFTEWHAYFPTAMVFHENRLLPFPVNTETLRQLYGLRLQNEEEVRAFWEAQRLPIKHPRNLEETIVAQVGWALYETLFKGYTIKYWARDPRQLDGQLVYKLTARTKDQNYITNRYQGLPRHGFSSMFQRMIAHRNISVLLQQDYREVLEDIKFNRLIFTGFIGDFFGHVHGAVEFRSCRFEYETLDREFQQPCLQVNYPNDFAFKRIIEFKHATGQKHPKTTIAREYAIDAKDNGEPFYPVPTRENLERFQRYEREARKLKSVLFCGRLANFRYYPMDVAVARALKLFEAEAQQ